MQKNQPLAVRSALLVGLLSLAASAVAQVPCPGVCVGFSSSVAGVPLLSPEAIGLLSLFVAGAGYTVLRRRSGLLAFVLAATVASISMLNDVRQAVAVVALQVILAAGNFASVALPANYVGLVNVQNTLGMPATVTSLAVGPGFALNPVTTLHVGSVIPAGGSLAVAVDVLPVAGGAFAALEDMTVSDNYGGGLPISAINASGVIDPAGRGIVYSATGLPNDINGSLSIDPNTGIISGTYDSQAALFSATAFAVTVTAHPTGSTLSVSRSFVLGIRNDG